jgi:hypothetical protein
MVRTLNAIGVSEAVSITATPTTLPAISLPNTSPGNNEVILRWSRPADNNGSVRAASHPGGGLPLIDETEASEADGTPSAPGENTIHEVLSHFGEWSGSGHASARINADHTKFLRLLLSGDEVHSSNYTITAGSTIITLLEGYLKTLPNDDHEFIAEFEDGVSAVIRLTVTGNVFADDVALIETNVEIADTVTAARGNMLLAVIILSAVFLLLSGAALFIIKNKKKPPKPSE